MLEELTGQAMFDRSQNWQGKSIESTSDDTDQAESEPDQSPAESSPNPMNERFKQMDTNSDGKISLSDEIPEQAKQFLTPLDANKDGFIDEKEMTEAASRMGEGMRSRGEGMRPGGEGGRGSAGGRRGPRNRPGNTQTPAEQ